MEGISYTTNNIPALEEKNISLFLNYVEEEIKLPAIFGGFGSKVFQKFANFYVALSGLARLSKSIDKKYEIPKFNSSGERTVVGYQDMLFGNNNIQGYREANYQLMKDINLERAHTSLDSAFEELIAFNSRFLNEILGSFETYEKKNTKDLLKREFFPVFQLQKLKTIHAKLQVQLENLQHCYTDIGRVFDDVKDDFIIYSKIIAQIELAMTFYTNQMSESPDVIHALEEMEQDMPTSIKELAQMIPQYAMSWPMLLDSIWKRAYKERRADVEQEARKAHQLICDVVAQMDHVAADVQYKEAITEFAQEIKDIDDLTQFGVLVKVVKEVGFAQGVLQNPCGENFKEIELLIFDKCVVALEVTPKRVTGRIMGVPMTIEISIDRTFRRAFQAEDFNVIINREISGVAKLFIKKIKDKRPVEEESFVLKLQVDLATEVERELRKNHKRILAKIQEGSEHEGHSYSKYNGRGNLDECGVRCGECQRLMQGLFFCGIKCSTCNGIFHTECFSAKKDESDSEDGCIQDPVYYLIQKQSDLMWEDFFVPHADQETAQRLLINRSGGTFLVIETEAGMTLIVKTINTEQLTSYKINTVKVDGETLYYIQKGTSAKNILDLVSCHRRSHHLYTPITLKEIFLDQEDDSSNEEITDEDEPETHLIADEDETGEHSNYFWGDMTAKEAEEKLADTPPGTFLLRKNNNQFRLSWKTSHPKPMHGIIKIVNGKFQLTNFTFDNLHQLTSYFQIQTKNQKIALGWPLLKDVDMEAGGLKMGQEYSKIPGFLGKISAKDAEEMLRSRPDGAYMVRMLVNDYPDSKQATPYRISYKHKDKISHLKFEISSKGYMATHPELEGGQIFAATLSKMFDMLQFNEKSDPFVEILERIDDMINKSYINQKESKMCQLMMEKFEAETLAEAFSSFQGIQKEAALMILQQALPDLSNELRKISKLKLENFKDKNNILSYLDAVIKSGIAADIQHGIVFLVGNTGVGKSSLAGTLKAYIENPSDSPHSILAGTGEHKHLLETQVLEVYNEIPFEQNQYQSVKLTEESESGPTLVDFVDEVSSEEVSVRNKNINIRLVDMGGHQEYYACSSLFFSTSGLFLICFDSLLLQKIDDLDDEYYGAVGTFVNLVSQTSSRSGMKLKIALVATKNETTKQFQNHEASCIKLLEITKDHLTSLPSELFLVNEVFMTSAKKVTVEILENLRTKIATICSDVKLKGDTEEIRPFSWHKFLDAASQDPYMSLDYAEDLWEKEKAEVGEAKNLTPEESKSLLTLQSIVKILNDELTLDSGLQAKKGGLEEKRSKQLPKERKEPEIRESPKTEAKSEEARKVKRDEDFFLDEIKVDDTAREVETTNEEGGAKETPMEGRKEVTAILSYFADYGEVLWFQTNKNLHDYVITQPTTFVKSLRTVITHKVKDKFNGIKFEDDMRDLLNKGCLSFNVFCEAYNKQHHEFTAQQAWTFMKELGLAFPVVSADIGNVVNNEEDRDLNETVMIPCLIKDGMERRIKDAEKDMERSKDSLCLIYKFDQDTSTIWIYYKLLEVFTKTFLGRHGGTFDIAYSQKIEKRRLGTVGGIRGTLKWTNSKQGIQNPKQYSFLLLEHESTKDARDLDSVDVPFSLNRGVKIHLQPMTGEMTEDMFSILEQIDKAFLPHLGDVNRSLACQKCQEKGEIGCFRVTEGVHLVSDAKMCSNLEHFPDRQVIELIKRKQKPFQMKNLLDVEKSALHLQAFEESDIKKDMLSGKLEAGEQIWIFHDRQENPCNLVARYNKYAHVVVYIGATNGIHEVVHISIASWTRGPMKAKIRRQNVLEVIGPGDKVFLGHKIPSCEMSANLREEIVIRAKKCAAKPSLVFDYHYRYHTTQPKRPKGGRRALPRTLYHLY